MFKVNLKYTGALLKICSNVALKVYKDVIFTRLGVIIYFEEAFV